MFRKDNSLICGDIGHLIHALLRRVESFMTTERNIECEPIPLAWSVALMGFVKLSHLDGVNIYGIFKKPPRSEVNLVWKLCSVQMTHMTCLYKFQISYVQCNSGSR